MSRDLILIAVGVALFTAGYFIGRDVGCVQTAQEILGDLQAEQGDILSSKAAYQSPADDAAPTTTDTADTAGS